MSVKIGQQIRTLRSEHKITQAELATAIGVSVQAVSKWECGGTPDVDLLPAIAGFFNVTIDHLFGFESHEGVDISDRIQQELERTPEVMRMDRAMELAWAVFKGLSGVPNIRELGYTEPYVIVEDDCTRGHVLFDTGVAYASGEAACPSVFILPQPKDGYGSMLYPMERYVELFEMLSSPLQMSVLCYLYSRREIPFSLEHIVSSLEADPEQVSVCLEKLKPYGWIKEEEVELSTGSVMLYRPVISVAFLGVLYFSSEVMRKTRLWYLSNAKRNTPIFDGKSTKR